MIPICSQWSNRCEQAVRFVGLLIESLLDDEAKGQKLISVKCAHCNFKMHKTIDFHSNVLVCWELMTEGYQGRPVKCAHFERPTRHSISLVRNFATMESCLLSQQWNLFLQFEQALEPATLLLWLLCLSQFINLIGINLTAFILTLPTSIVRS